MQLQSFAWGRFSHHDLAAQRSYYHSFTLEEQTYSTGEACVFFPDLPGQPLYVGRILSAFTDRAAGAPDAHCIEVRWCEHAAKLDPDCAMRNEREVIELAEGSDVNPLGSLAGKTTILRAHSLHQAEQIARSQGLTPGSWFYSRGIYQQSTREFLVHPSETSPGYDTTPMQAQHGVERPSTPPAHHTYQLPSTADVGLRKGRGSSSSSGSGDPEPGARSKKQKLSAPGDPEAAPKHSAKQQPSQLPLLQQQQQQQQARSEAACFKQCVECGATQTPQWREGPAGPGSLCNACGVRLNRLRASRSKGSCFGARSASARNKASKPSAATLARPSYPAPQQQQQEQQQQQHQPEAAAAHLAEPVATLYCQDNCPEGSSSAAPPPPAAPATAFSSAAQEGQSSLSGESIDEDLLLSCCFPLMEEGLPGSCCFPLMEDAKLPGSCGFEMTKEVLHMVPAAAPYAAAPYAVDLTRSASAASCQTAAATPGHEGSQPVLGSAVARELEVTFAGADVLTGVALKAARFSPDAEEFGRVFSSFQGMQGCLPAESTQQLMAMVERADAAADAAAAAAADLQAVAQLVSQHQAAADKAQASAAQAAESFKDYMSALLRQHCGPHAAPPPCDEAFGLLAMQGGGGSPWPAALLVEGELDMGSEERLGLLDGGALFFGAGDCGASLLDLDCSFAADMALMAES